MRFPTKSIIGVVLALSVPAISFAGDCFYGTGAVNSGARTAYPADWNGQDAPITYRSCDQGGKTVQLPAQVYHQGTSAPVQTTSKSPSSIQSMSGLQYCTALFNKYPTIGQSDLFLGQGSVQRCACEETISQKYIPASFNQRLRQKVWDKGHDVDLIAESFRLLSVVSIKTIKRAHNEEQQKCSRL